MACKRIRKITAENSKGRLKMHQVEALQYPGASRINLMCAGRLNLKREPAILDGTAKMNSHFSVFEMQPNQMISRRECIEIPINYRQIGLLSSTDDPPIRRRTLS